MSACWVGVGAREGKEGEKYRTSSFHPSSLLCFFVPNQWFVFILFYFSATALQPCFPLGSLVIPRQRSSEIDEGSKTRKEIPDHLQRSVVANLIAVAGSVGIE